MPDDARRPETAHPPAAMVPSAWWVEGEFGPQAGPQAARALGCPYAQPWVESGGLASLANALEAGRLAVAVVAYHRLRGGRHEPTLALLTRQGGRLQIAATAVVETSAGPVMFARLVAGDSSGGAAVAATGYDRTLLAARLFDQQGILSRLLAVLAHHDINVAHLDNRPDDRGGQYFHLDLECHANEPRCQAALASLKQTVDPKVELTVLGGGPMTRFFTGPIPRVLVIGGTGGIGAFLSQALLVREGLTVTLAGRDTTPPYTEIAADHQAVLFAVPLDQTVPVIAAVAPRCRPGSLLVNLASCQTPGMAAMLQHAPRGCQTLGVHTVFGPNVARLGGKNAVVCRGGDPTDATAPLGPLAEAFVALLRKRALHLTTLPATVHDTRMAVVQTAWHRLLLATLAASVDTLGEALGQPSPLSPRAMSWTQHLPMGRDFDTAALLIVLGARLLDNSESLLWGLQTLGGDGRDPLGGLGDDLTSQLPPSAYGLDKDLGECLDRLLVSLGRACPRPLAHGAQVAPWPAMLAVAWPWALRHWVRGMIADRTTLAELLGVASPHFVAGVLAALSMDDDPAWHRVADRELARPGGPASVRAALSRLRGHHGSIAARVGSNDRAGFARWIDRLRCAIGPEFIAWSVEATRGRLDNLLDELQALGGVQRLAELRRGG